MLRAAARAARCALPAALAALTPALAGAQLTVTGAAVPGQRSIFEAGGGGATGFSFAAAPDQVLRVTSVTGGVSCCTFDPPNGADGAPAVGPVPGGRNTNILSANGISGLRNTDAYMFLVGVFLTDAPPSVAATPDRLDFTSTAIGTNFTTLAPAIAQTFFIGDGRVGSGGAVQDFLVPAGATRLFLGFADAFEFGGDVPGGRGPGFYGDNSGQLLVDLTIGAAPTAAPEPSTLLLAAGGLLALGAARRARRRW
jgi:hypothetical protein